jgi:hypothetical protein
VQVVEPSRAPFISHRLAMAFDRAERKQRLPPRLGRRDAFSNQAIGFRLEMKLEFLIETRLGVSGPKD